jgi:hypothetical protein
VQPFGDGFFQVAFIGGDDGAIWDERNHYEFNKNIDWGGKNIYREVRL